MVRTRILSLLLIFCLLVDTSQAAVQSLPSRRYAATMALQKRFTNQALEHELFLSERLPMFTRRRSTRSFLLHGAKWMFLAGLILSNSFSSLRAQTIPIPDEDRYIQQAQTDPNPALRNLAVGILVNYPSQKLLAILAHIAETDPDPLVRQTARMSINALADKGYYIRLKSKWQRALVYGSGIYNYVRYPAGLLYYPQHELMHAAVSKAMGAGVKTFSILPPVITTETFPEIDPKKGYVVVKDFAPANVAMSVLRVKPGIGIMAYMEPRTTDSRWRMTALAAAPYAVDMLMMKSVPLRVLDLNRVNADGYYERTFWGKYVGRAMGASQGGTLLAFLGGDFNTIAKQILPGTSKKKRIGQAILGMGIGFGVSYTEYKIDAGNVKREARGNNVMLKLVRLLAASFGFNDRWAVLAARLSMPFEIGLLMYAGWHSDPISMAVILGLLKILEILIEGVTALVQFRQGHSPQTMTPARLGKEILNLLPYLILTIPAIQTYVPALFLFSVIAAGNHLRFDWSALTPTPLRPTSA